MANKSKRNRTQNNSRKRINPLSRNNIRFRTPKLNFDGQTLLGTSISGSMTASSSIAALFVRVDCGASGAVATALTAITGLYSEYRFKWVKFHWMPSVAPGVAAAGGRIYMATIHNPEQMVTLDAASSATQNTTAKTARDMKTWNAWERFTYNVPLMMRRKWFDVNSSVSSTVDNYDRSVQDYVLATADTVGATDSLGQFQMEFMVELRGLNTVST